MNPFMTIEDINDANLAAVLGLKVAAAQRAYIETNAQSLQEAMNDHDHDWRCYALCENRQPVGFMMIGAENRTDKYIWLDRFMIGQQYQGQGLGTQFLKRAIGFIEDHFEVDEIVLSLHTENTYAKFFYVQAGFTDIKRIDETNGEEIWVYRLT
ncbi:GNAT family N-acetyltransferase [Exiguobacterium sp. H66]|uniref:GNAT family N-acetyltransferase n=1 Tax=Exiguobacterium sp. H66 TaxID=2751208 RepID=UPI001BE528D3|nr:GNAT family N-acetyltransferase [Exiguobacterium sp. H66]